MNDSRTDREQQARDEERLLLLENMREIVSRHLPDSTILYVSPSCHRFMGFTPEEMVGTRAADYVHPDDVAPLLATLEGALTRRDQRYRVRHRTRHHDGGYIRVETEGRILYAPDGAPREIQCVVRDITERHQAEEALHAAYAKLDATLNALPDLLFELTDEGLIYDCRAPDPLLLPIPPAECVGRQVEEVLPKPAATTVMETLARAMESGRPETAVYSIPGTNETRWFELSVARGDDAAAGHLVALAREFTARKRAEEVVEKRILALTHPLDDRTAIAFEDLFNLADIQRLQNEFSAATGVASIITHPDGTPLTEPSNFCRLCSSIIRKTEKGLTNCYRSDQELGRPHPDGPIVQPCMSGGLWDAGAGISVGGHHIANWLIGQVRDEAQDEEKMRAYAREIGADEKTFLEAFREVPAMAREQFDQVASALFTMANLLSTTAYQNVQQARFIDERRWAEKALREEKTLSEEYINALPGLFYVFDTERFVRWNRKYSEVSGYSPKELAEMYGPDFFEGSDRELIAERMRNVFVEGFADVEADFVTKDGRRIPHYFTGHLVEIDGEPHLVGLAIDITQRRRAEEEQERLQSQLLQAQKMESVGRLAGGVAHDFNNMLGVILGHAELAIEQVDRADPLHANLEEIEKSARRSAELTRQLLAFARKQTVAPRVLDLNDLVTSTLKMLQRLIGEDIDLEWSPGEMLWPVRMDPSQIDQILANLCVNARDAIDGVGKITIETENAAFDEAYCEHHAGFTPGEYAVLTVSDDGCGMEKEILAHLFEPFFTTKGVGKGTGLGLATIYGIVRQNQGFVHVYSEPQRGSSFRVYLPRKGGVAAQVDTDRGEQVVRGGKETILLVEDEEANRKLGARMLRRLGYQVLVASTPRVAIEISEEQAGPIDLLLTDVVMPEMNGRALAEEILVRRPKVKLLFMSGYTANVIARRGVLDEGVHFLEKPFATRDLASAVRRALESE